MKRSSGIYNTICPLLVEHSDGISPIEFLSSTFLILLSCHTVDLLKSQETVAYNARSGLNDILPILHSFTEVDCPHMSISVDT